MTSNILPCCHGDQTVLISPGELATQSLLSPSDYRGAMLLSTSQFQMNVLEKIQKLHLDMDQLKYSLRSLELYIPWARHVYIVTNGQGMDFVWYSPNFFLILSM